MFFSIEKKYWFLPLCILLVAGCGTSRPSLDTAPAQVPEPVEKAPEPEEKKDFAETRPQVLDREELTVVFSKGDVELDFRKSYLASEAQLLRGAFFIPSVFFGAGSGCSGKVGIIRRQTAMDFYITAERALLERR